MGACSIIAEIARWSYFIIAVLSVMNSFIHLHIQLKMNKCTENLQHICIGRNLAWRNEDDFDFDTNKDLWRQVFTLQPEIFFDIWPPIILSILAVLQHFDTFKWEAISGDWGRAFLFIVAWQLFCVLGYGSNFGVVIGLIGLCGVAFIYLIMCILLILGIANTDVRDQPVLDLTTYLSICFSFDTIKQRRNSNVASVNHENDEHYPLSPEFIKKNNSDAASNIVRLSMTQPGSVHMTKRGGNINKTGYNEVNLNDGSSGSDNDHNELKENEYQETAAGYDRVVNVALPNVTNREPNYTGCEVESPSESDTHDGLYNQPDPDHVTPR